MRALTYIAPHQMQLENRQPAVPIDSSELLINIAHVGICGSDMHAYLGHDERRPPPLILGHEASGIVMSDGPLHAQPVAINPLVVCGACSACGSGHDNLCAQRQIISMPPREGAFAEQLYMPPRNLTVVPDLTPLWHGALCEPMACGWHAVRLGLEASSASLPVRSALVLGGGAIGVASALSLKIQSTPATVMIVEPNDKRRQRLSHDLPEFTYAKDLSDHPTGVFDVVIDAVGYAGTRRTASVMARPGGVIAHIGLGDALDGLDVRRMTLQEITFVGTYTYTAADFRDTAQAIFDGKFGDFAWVEHRQLDDGALAFEDLQKGTVEAAKVMLTI